MADEKRRIVLDALNEQLMRLLRGEAAEQVAYEDDVEPELEALRVTVNHLAVLLMDARDFIQSLAEGELDAPSPSHNLLLSPFKQLQANLRHLTWQAGQIAAGDYSQRVYFMGRFSDAFNAMVEALEEKERTEALLRETQARVKRLEGIIPICMYCKKIRDDSAMWRQLEQYIMEHSGAMFSHGVCPECYEKVKADLARLKESKNST
ncbi:MAG TPA: hypothetical protein VMJ66_02695 [Geobacteraceae bacterium]|nr:hypothetical protein [Geobacteraceae bacterium]